MPVAAADGVLVVGRPGSRCPWYLLRLWSMTRGITLATQTARGHGREALHEQRFPERQATVNTSIVRTLEGEATHQTSSRNDACCCLQPFHEARTPQLRAVGRCHTLTAVSSAFVRQRYKIVLGCSRIATPGRRQKLVIRQVHGVQLGHTVNTSSTHSNATGVAGNNSAIVSTIA